MPDESTAPTTPTTAELESPQVLEAKPAASLDDLNQHLDSYWVDLAQLLGSKVDTSTYNALTSLSAQHRATLAGLFSREK